MFGLCSISIPEFGLGYTFWRPACGRQAWREEKKLAKTQRRKEKIDAFAAWRLCEQKKKISTSTASDGTAIKIN
jgi:hypothetical protein